ncbi:Cytochrome P450 2U1 [Holothuria leucospilota]|uniref:Cytochrome P450 2U1 n=1 Tax=Holothuria leucospilota TaxID=206669 RepID=A0A9Q1CJB2_HOLLE|nr:Cytochrome P450 2U1 [Holothuria leucospilota]
MSSVGAVLLSVVVFLLLVVVTRLFRRPNNVPPGPKGLPLIGNGLIMKRDDIHMMLTEYSRTYGGIFSLMVGPKLLVVLGSFEAAKEALIDNGAAFSSRFALPLLRYLVGIDGSLILGNGPKWKALRKFVFSSFRDFGVGKRSLEQRINDEATHVLDILDQTNGRPLDPHHTINNAVSNIIFSLCFGERFDYSDERFKTLLGKMDTNISYVSRTGISHILPFLTEMPVYRFVKHNFQSLKDFIKSLAKEHEDSLNPDDVRDILDKYLLEIKRQQDSGEEIRFKKADEWRLVFELFLAGTDTTTNTLLFFILFVTHHQGIQQKIFDEIMEVVGGARRPQFTDKPNMPYTEATILEILRLRPAAPLGVPRMVDKDTKITGYVVPEGTTVFFDVFAINRDPQLWDKPHIFDPTRFLSPDGKKVIKSDTLLTFGAGRRICVGETLARMELFFFVTNIFQRFHFRFPEDETNPDLEGAFGLTMRPAPFKICAERR